MNLDKVHFSNKKKNKGIKAKSGSTVRNLPEERLHIRSHFLLD